MADYEYSPVSSEYVTLHEDPPITLPASRETVGYTESATSLAALDIFEDTLPTQPIEVPYSEYTDTPVQTFVIPLEESKKYPKYNEPRLIELSKKENDIRQNNLKKKKKSKKGFLSNLATVYMEIIDELMFVNSIEDLKDIFLKDERLVALGLLLISISFFLVFFNRI